MSLPSEALRAVLTSGPVLEALRALSPAIGNVAKDLPLVGMVADYIDGNDGVIPDAVPSHLRSDIELAKLRVLAAKANAPAPPEKPAGTI